MYNKRTLCVLFQTILYEVLLNYTHLEAQPSSLIYVYKSISPTWSAKHIQYPVKAKTKKKSTQLNLITKSHYDDTLNPKCALI